MTATVTLDATILSDVEPWVPSVGWEYAAGELKVLDGALMLATGATAILVSTKPPPTGNLDVTTVLIDSNGKPGVAFVNSDGDGYVAEFLSDVIQIYIVEAGIKGADFSWNFGIDRAPGDVVRAEYIRDMDTPDSDTFNVYLNGNPTPITTASGLTYVEGMSPGVCTSGATNGFSSITVEIVSSITINFSGTPNTSLPTDDAYYLYGEGWRYGADGISIFCAAAEGYSQIAVAEIANGIYSVKITFYRFAVGSNDSIGVAYIDGLGVGFACELGETTLYIKYLGGGGSIATVPGLPETVGEHEFEVILDVSTGDVTAKLDTVSVGAAVYEGENINTLNGAAAHYRSASAVDYTISQIVVGPESAPVASIIGLASELSQGETYTCSTTLLGEWASVTFGSKELTFVDGVSITLPAWTGGYVEELNLDASHTLTITDVDDLTATIVVSYVPPAGYTHNQMGAGMSVDTGDKSIGKDPAIIAGTEVFPPPLSGGTMNNAGLFDSVPFGTYVVFWLRDLDLQMWPFDVVITDSTVIVVPGSGTRRKQQQLAVLYSYPQYYRNRFTRRR